MTDANLPDINILELIDDTKRVLVVGPIVVNETIYGVCKRIASDFPIPVFEITKKVYDIGGPGNLVKNIKAMGLAVDLITMVGEGEKYVVDTMDQEGIDATGAITCSDYSVAKKIRYMCDGYLSFRANEGNEDFIVDEDTQTKIISTFKEKLNEAEYSVVVLSDYRFGMLSEQVSSSIIMTAKSKNIPVIVDPPKFGTFNKFTGCTIFKPNLDEAKYFLNHVIDSEKDIKRACMEICEKLQCPYTILTLAERGIALYSKETGVFNVFPVQEGLDVVDVNGAGDTVLAVIALGIATKIRIENICRLANLCAGNVIQRTGTIAVNLLDIIRERYKVLKYKKEIQNLLKIVPDSVDKVLVTWTFSAITNFPLNDLKQAKQNEEIVFVAVDTNNTNDIDVEIVKNVLVCHKYIDFIIIPADFEIDWLTYTLKPKQKFDLG